MEQARSPCSQRNSLHRDPRCASSAHWWKNQTDTMHWNLESGWNAFPSAISCCFLNKPQLAGLLHLSSNCCLRKMICLMSTDAGIDQLGPRLPSQWIQLLAVVLAALMKFLGVLIQPALMRNCGYLSSLEAYLLCTQERATIRPQWSNMK